MVVFIHSGNNWLRFNVLSAFKMDDSDVTPCKERSFSIAWFLFFDKNVDFFHSNVIEAIEYSVHHLSM